MDTRQQVLGRLICQTPAPASGRSQTERYLMATGSAHLPERPNSLRPQGIQEHLQRNFLPEYPCQPESVQSGWRHHFPQNTVIYFSPWKALPAPSVSHSSVVYLRCNVSGTRTSIPEISCATRCRMKVNNSVSSTSPSSRAFFSSCASACAFVSR